MNIIIHKMLNDKTIIEIRQVIIIYCAGVYLKFRGKTLKDIDYTIFCY